MARGGLVKGLKLDGKLSTAWKRVPAVEFVDRNGSTPEHAASCRIAYDAQHLWFSFENHEPQMDKLTAKATTRDSRVWKVCRAALPGCHALTTRERRVSMPAGMPTPAGGR